MRLTFLAVILAAMCSVPGTAICAQAETKIVTRIDEIAVVLKGKKLTIRVFGMGTTSSRLPQGGKLVRRNPDNALNKEGLLEYNLVYKAPPNYTGFAMKRVSASLKESHLPPGLKGVRIFSELNHIDELLPEPQKKKGGLFHRRGGEKAQEAAGNQ
jgi:hypothetical protein